MSCAFLPEKFSLGYSDLTGRFPYRSSEDHKYILIVYNYDGNALHAQPLKNREYKSIENAWELIHKKYILSASQPKKYILDNERSEDLQQAFEKYNVTFQKDKPHLHRANCFNTRNSDFQKSYESNPCLHRS